MSEPTADDIENARTLRQRLHVIGNWPGQDIALAQALANARAEGYADAQRDRAIRDHDDYTDGLGNR